LDSRIKLYNLSEGKIKKTNGVREACRVEKNKFSCGSYTY